MIIKRPDMTYINLYKYWVRVSQVVGSLFLRGNQKWTIQSNWQHSVHRTKKSKTHTQRNMCWTPLYASKYNPTNWLHGMFISHNNKQRYLIKWAQHVSRITLIVKIFDFPIFVILRIPDEGYFRNTSLII
jgi:hypothetical protein